MSDNLLVASSATRRSRIVRVLIAPVIVLVVLGMLARTGCLGPISDLVGSGDLKRLRAQAILDPPPGATEVGRTEQRTMQTLLGRVDGHVYVLYASPQSQAELLDHYLATHGGVYQLEDVPGNRLLRRRGCDVSDCRNNQVSVLIDASPRLSPNAPTIVTTVPADTKNFAFVRVVDPIP